MHIKFSAAELNNPNIQQLIRLLELTTYKIWESVASGIGPESVKDTAREMRNPKIGDLVMEISTFRKNKQFYPKMIKNRGISGIGYLCEVAEDPSCSTESIIKILNFNENDLFTTWENAEFIKVPIDLLTQV